MRKTLWKTNMFLCISATMFILVESSSKNECGPYMEHIVSGPNGVPDENISASSMYPDTNNNLHDPKYGRLYHYLELPPQWTAGAWSALYRDTSQYIQVAFTNLMIVCAVLTQGREMVDQWITSFAVLHSLDGVTWENVENTENDKVFIGNFDRLTVVRNNFRECVEANYMRINPKTWAYDSVSLRMGFLGCSKNKKDFLLAKNIRHAQFWKRTSATKGDVIKLSEILTTHVGSCAIVCHQMSRCEDYSFNSNDEQCVLFGVGNSQNTDNDAEESTFYSRNIEYIAKTSDYQLKTLENHRVYYKIITEKQVKSEASQICAEDEARLLVVDNSEIMTVIQNDIRKNLILAQETEYFVNGEYIEGKWVFGTTLEVPVNLWASSYPLNDNGTCIVVTETGLKSKDCQSQLYFVCEILI